MDSRPDLQFERAEFATPAATLACEACQQPITPTTGSSGRRAASAARPTWSCSRRAAPGPAGAAYALSGEGLLALVLLVGVLRLLGEAPAEHDWGVFAQFAVLVVALAALTTLPVPLP